MTYVLKKLLFYFSVEMASIISFIIIPLLFNYCYGKMYALCQYLRRTKGVGANITFEVILSLLANFCIWQCLLLARNKDDIINIPVYYTSFAYTLLYYTHTTKCVGGGYTGFALSRRSVGQSVRLQFLSAL